MKNGNVKVDFDNLRNTVVGLYADLVDSAAEVDVKRQSFFRAYTSSTPDRDRVDKHLGMLCSSLDEFRSNLDKLKQILHE